MYEKKVVTESTVNPKQFDIFFQNLTWQCLSISLCCVKASSSYIQIYLINKPSERVIARFGWAASDGVITNVGYQVINKHFFPYIRPQNLCSPRYNVVWNSLSDGWKNPRGTSLHVIRNYYYFLLLLVSNQHTSDCKSKYLTARHGCATGDNYSHHHIL